MDLIKSMNLKISAWAAIISVIILIPSFIIALLSMIKPENQLFDLLTLITMVIGIIVFIPLVLGYIKIAKISKIKLVEKIIYIYFMIGIMLSIFAFFINKDSSLNLVLLLLLGISEIMMGIALLRLKKVFKEIIPAISILYIVSGVFAFTIIFAVFYPFIVIVISILEAIFFFRASKKYDR
jgi:hypothetical protein